MNVNYIKHYRLQKHKNNNHYSCQTGQIFSLFGAPPACCEAADFHMRICALKQRGCQPDNPSHYFSFTSYRGYASSAHVFAKLHLRCSPLLHSYFCSYDGHSLRPSFAIQILASITASSQPGQDCEAVLAIGPARFVIP